MRADVPTNPLTDEMLLAMTWLLEDVSLGKVAAESTFDQIGAKLVDALGELQYRRRIEHEALGTDDNTFEKLWQDYRDNPRLLVGMEYLRHYVTFIEERLKVLTAENERLRVGE